MDIRGNKIQKRGKTVFFRQNAIFYLLGLLFILGMKYFYGRAGSDELRWILAPTTGWVEILSGIPFVYEPGLGYVNHDFRFLIAPSCSGVQFMIITAATLLFSFVHRVESFLPAARGAQSCGTESLNTDSHGAQSYSAGFSLSAMKFGWMGVSLLLSYLFTVFVNGLRILAAIHVPDFLDGLGIHSAFLTDDRLHTIIGVVVYFVFLLSLYGLVESVFEKGRGGKSAPRRGQIVRSLLPPVFWYLFIVLGIPFLNRACQKQPEKFAEFAAMITVCCAVILLLYGLALGFRKCRKGMTTP